MTWGRRLWHRSNHGQQTPDCFPAQETERCGHTASLLQPRAPFFKFLPLKQNHLLSNNLSLWNSPRLDAVLCSLLWVTLLQQGVGLGDPQRALPTPAILGFVVTVPDVPCPGRGRSSTPSRGAGLGSCPRHPPAALCDPTGSSPSAPIPCQPLPGRPAGEVLSPIPFFTRMPLRWNFNPGSTSSST